MISKEYIDTWEKVGIYQVKNNPNLFYHELDQSVKVDLSAASREGAIYIFMKKAHDIGRKQCQLEMRDVLGFNK